MKGKCLAIVVPCYNEEEVFETTNGVLLGVLNDLIAKDKISADSYILYVNDGSKDSTWQHIKEAYAKDVHVHGLSFAGNRGHQNALYAGLMEAKKTADMTISIDADLQDDVAVIEEMVDKYHEGCDIVYGVRSKRTTDTFFKRFTAESFYKVMNMMGAKSVYNHADFRLMSKRSLDELSLYGETHLFLRGIVPNLGFQTAIVTYERKERMAGESKYPLKKMIAFAFDGITSFSVKPLTMILFMGFCAIMVAFIAVIYSLFRHFSGHTVPGWTSLFVSVWFLGGVQLFAIGIVGQYVGKAFIEAKKRPRYYVEEVLDHSEEKKAD